MGHKHVCDVTDLSNWHALIDIIILLIMFSFDKSDSISYILGSSSKKSLGECKQKKLSQVHVTTLWQEVVCQATEHIVHFYK